MRRVIGGALVYALAMVAPGCDREAPAEGQLVVYVTTDAPVGPAGPSPSLFDRMRVEIVAPHERSPCVGCTREFALDDDRMARGEASFGFFPKPFTSGYRARVLVFRSGGTSSGEPRRASTLERVVSLPPTAATGVIDVTVMLPLADLAAVRGSLDAPLEPVVGRPSPGIVGSFPGAQLVPCAEAPRDDEACVPGGAFWMGNPRLDLLDAREADGTSERVVVLSPFFLDRAEVTVAAMRAARVARVIDDPVEGDRPGALKGCLYTAAAGPNDELPVNCLSWQRAKAYCAKVGKRLPTEAEWEFAASARASRPFPWGASPPSCADAVNGSGDSCLLVRAPRPAGSGARDRVSFGGAELLDLGGNVRELTADRYRPGGSACWGMGIFVNPVCESPADDVSPIPRSVRGGGYRDEPTLLRAALRTFLEDERFAVSDLVGLRCAH